MAKANSTVSLNQTSLPYRVVIDFLEGTLRKQDAVAFARGFIEHHFDAVNDSGYYVAPYVGGYIFEVQEGGAGKAYLPGVLQTLDNSPTASACIQMARRVLEVKKSGTGVYTAILLPEGTEPQNPDKVFPEAGPKLIPFQRSGLAALVVGGAIFGVGLVALLLSTLAYLVEISGLLSPPLPKVDYNSLPLTQWSKLETAAGGKSSSYIKSIRYQNGRWIVSSGTRQDPAADLVAPPGTPLTGSGPMMPEPSNPLAPPTMPQPTMPAPNGVQGSNPTPAPPTSVTPGTMLPPPPATIVPSSPAGLSPTGVKH